LKDFTEETLTRKTNEFLQRLKAPRVLHEVSTIEEASLLAEGSDDGAIMIYHKKSRVRVREIQNKHEDQQQRSLKELLVGVFSYAGDGNSVLKKRAELHSPIVETYRNHCVEIERKSLKGSVLKESKQQLEVSQNKYFINKVPEFSMVIPMVKKRFRV
jgi:hypothetical protein